MYIHMQINHIKTTSIVIILSYLKSLDIVFATSMVPRTCMEQQFNTLYVTVHPAPILISSKGYLELPFIWSES